MFFNWYYENENYEQECADTRDLGRTVVKGVRKAVIWGRKPVVVVLVHHTVDGRYTHSAKQNVTQAKIDAAAPYAEYQHPPHPFGHYYTKAHPAAAAALAKYVPK